MPVRALSREAFPGDTCPQMSVSAAEQELEGRFRALIENSIDILAIVDAETRVIYISPSVTRILGYTPEELTGTTSMNIVHPDDAPLLGAIFTKGLDESDLATNEFRARHKDGTWRIMEAFGVNLLDDPAVRGMVFTARDVTARRALEQRLRQAERLEAVGQLAGGIAHDFNNVLLVIRGYSSVLRSALDDPQLVADVDEIANAADRAAELTRQLLAFGRRQVLQPRLLDLGETVHGIESLLRRTLPSSVELALDVPDGLAIVADPAQIEESIFNLVFNARDAMPSGGRVEVAAQAVAASGAEEGISPPLAPGRYVAISVADTGTGIAPDVLPHIFEPFFTTKEDGIGTGLGLSTVYGVAAQTGGGIGVAAREAGGTQFTLYLPAATPASAQAEWGDVPAEGFAGGTETILLVEDEEPVRELVRRVLETAGYTVVAAALPSEAERLLDATPEVDLLLTDVVMPEMSGYDLAARVRERRPDVRRLFISGYAPNQAGAPQGRLLKKPFAPDQLARAVRSTLDDDGTIEVS
jgi:two-component system, cell cycle sensor histidine kinase and response regulator CckA